MSSDPKSWKIAIVGSGALGSYYGAKLAHAGYNVHFLLRSDYEHVREHGLAVRSPGGGIQLSQVNAHAGPEDIGPCDVVLIALKTTGNEALAKLIPPLLGPETMLVTLQNGLGNEELLAAQFGEQRVLGGLCFVCLNRVASGVIEHYGHGTLSLGEFRRSSQQRTHFLAAAFRESGIETHVVENLVTERWRKLVWNIPFNGLSIVARANVEEVLGNFALEKLARTLMEETIAGAADTGARNPPRFH
ncbi:MAG: 2-dehydropantoate 2-reductase [Chthoniobacteraceae bacterium]